MGIALRGLMEYCTKKQYPSKPMRLATRWRPALALRAVARRSAMTTTAALIKTRIVKRLAPDQPGAKKLARQYGNALVCVRYRHDAVRGVRYTTVELIVEQAQLPAKRAKSTTVYVHISHLDARLKTEAQAEGARWDARRQAWRMSLQTARALDIPLDEILETHPPIDIKIGNF